MIIIKKAYAGIQIAGSWGIFQVIDEDFAPERSHFPRPVMGRAPSPHALRALWAPTPAQLAAQLSLLASKHFLRRPDTYFNKKEEERKEGDDRNTKRRLHSAPKGIERRAFFLASPVVELMLVPIFASRRGFCNAPRPPSALHRAKNCSEGAVCFRRG